MLSYSASDQSPLLAGPGVARAPRHSARLPRWLRAAIGAPLRVKLVGAGMLVMVVMTGLILALGGSSARDRETMFILIVGLLIMLVVNLALVSVALKPIVDLETLSGRVPSGDLEARAHPTPLADRDIARLGRGINVLLDTLVADRARMRRLAAQVIQTHDEDRARIARELHDSVAQELAAQMLQLGAAAQAMPTALLRERLLDIRTMMGATMEELRALSQTVYPEILDTLGLGAALSHLARDMHERCATAIDVAIGESAERVHAPVAAVLYHVAQEALKNACLHAGANHIEISLTADAGMVILEVTDDGTGFDVSAAEARTPAVGIFSMRERLALATGRLEIVSMSGRGTRVVATVPISKPRHV